MKNGLEILIVDDDSAHRVMLKKLLGGWGYRAYEADDGAVAIEEVRRRSFDLILMDIRMMKVSGIEALEQIKKINPTIPVMIMTAYASVETAVSALKKGAYDYLTKPLDFDELQIKIARATEHSLLKKENEYLKERLGEKFDRQNMIGQSTAMVRLLEIVEQVAPTRGHDSDHRRVGHRQGNDCQCHSLQQQPQAVRPLLKSTVRRLPKRFWSRNCSAMKKAHLPARTEGGKESFSRPTAAVFFWMK